VNVSKDSGSAAVLILRDGLPFNRRAPDEILYSIGQ